MKLNGKKLSGPNECVLYIPRGEEVIVIKARAVLSYDEFEKLIPKPNPPEKIVRGGGRVPDFESKIYQKEIMQYGELRTSWMILQSLKAWEGMEWETVDLADPNTFNNYVKELQEAGFSDSEMQKIILLVMEANALNEQKLQEARDRFLAGQVPEFGKSFSLKDGQPIMPSGELANGSGSVHPMSQEVGTN